MIWAILYLYAFYAAYIIVMGVWRARLAGRLTWRNNPVTFALCLPFVVIGLALDVVAQYTIATLIFADLPRRGEHLVTDRLQRYVAQRYGWRYRWARYVCDNLLDVFDPRGEHC